MNIWTSLQKDISPVSIAVFTILSILTIFSTVISVRYIEQEQEKAINTPLTIVEDRIENNLSRYSILTKGLEGLFQASERVTRQEFESYLQSSLNFTEEFPEISAVGYFKIIPRESLSVFTQEENNDTSLIVDGVDFQNFTIYPETENSVFYAATHLFPNTLYETFYGYDFSNEPKRAAAIEKALASNKLMLTEQIVLRTGVEGYVGVFPIDKNGEIVALGFVAFRAPVLFEALLEDTRIDSEVLRIFDIKTNPDENTLFTTGSDATNWDRSYTKAIPFVNQTLVVQYVPGPTLLILLPILIGILGSLATLGITLWSARLFALYKRVQGEKDTAEKKLEESESRFTKIYQSSASGMAIISPAGEVLDINPAMESLLQKQAREVIGQTLTSISPIDFDMLDTLEWKELAAGTIKSHSLETKVLSKHSHERWVIASFSSISEHGNTATPDYIILHTTDITKQKDLETLQQSFVSTASHQLRTPVTVISWNLESLEPVITKYLDAKQQDLYQSVQKSVEDITTLINDLLEISRADTGEKKIQAEPLHVHETLKHIVNAVLVSDTQSHTASIKLAPQIQNILTDPQSFKLIFQNLLENAVKFSAEQSTIKIIGNVIEDMLVFEIIDQGIGIPDAEKDHVFGRFFRTSNAESQGISGTGLGLSLVKEHVELLGGSIDFNSSEGEGTTFYVRIPYIPMKSAE